MNWLFAHVPRRIAPLASGRRQFSVKAIYASFPATLHYYKPGRTSDLFKYPDDGKIPEDRLHDEAVRMHEDGLVYPGVEGTTVSNGAVMYPNTFMMQELVRQYFDEVLDREDTGRHTEMPYIYTIPRGTPVPSHFTLINEYISRFSLQSSRGIPLSELNTLLDDFWREHAQKELAEAWIDRHPFPHAIADGADAVWTAR